MNKKLVFLDQGTLGDGLDLQPLKSLAARCGYHYQGYDQTSADQTADRIKRSAVVITNKCVLNRQMIESSAAEDLQLILVAATGYNVIDLNAAERRDITVCNAVNYATQSVVQHTLALTLTLTNRLLINHHHFTIGRWSTSQNFCVLLDPPTELRGMTVGIIGCGNIGRRVAAVLHSMGAKIKLAARNARDQRAGRLSLKNLLPQIDILCLHCPLNDATYHLISAAELSMMAPHALLVNTARGGLIDEHALLQALNDRQIGGAALDVLEQEPPSTNSPLASYTGKNLIITPHIAWASRASRASLLQCLKDNLVAFTQRRPINTLTTPVK